MTYKVSVEWICTGCFVLCDEFGTLARHTLHAIGNVTVERYGKSRLE